MKNRIGFVFFLAALSNSVPSLGQASDMSFDDASWDCQVQIATDGDIMNAQLSIFESDSVAPPESTTSSKAAVAILLDTGKGKPFDSLGPVFVGKLQLTDKLQGAFTVSTPTCRFSLQITGPNAPVTVKMEMLQSGQWTVFNGTGKCSNVQYASVGAHN